MEKNILEQARQLNQESHVGLLFCYKALKKFAGDRRAALAYLRSEEFKKSIHVIHRL